MTENARKGRDSSGFEEKRISGIRASQKVLDGLTLARIPGRSMELHPEMFSINAGAGHVTAKAWSVRDPTGRTYRFNNLSYFVRQNEDLFNKEDTVWRRGGNSMRCRAMQGVASLRPETKRTAGSWKGWVWES